MTQTNSQPWAAGGGVRRFASISAVALALLASAGVHAVEAVVPLPELDVAGYMGTWYQVAWFPNRFQKQCVSDTVAVYAFRQDGRVDVNNRCRTADGTVDAAVGLARPQESAISAGTLRPARLEVSFLPRFLRWLPIWGSYWVLQRAEDGRYVVVGEPTREYLWVLSRTPTLSNADQSAIRSRLLQQGWELSRWQTHPHVQPLPAPAAPR